MRELAAVNLEIASAINGIIRLVGKCLCWELSGWRGRVEARRPVWRLLWSLGERGGHPDHGTVAEGWKEKVTRVCIQNPVVIFKIIKIPPNFYFYGGPPSGQTQICELKFLSSYQINLRFQSWREPWEMLGLCSPLKSLGG